MRKHENRKKHASLLLAILLSVGVMTGIGIIGRFSIYKGYRLKLLEEPVLAVIFEATEDGVYPWNMITSKSFETIKTETIDAAVSVNDINIPKAKQENPSDDVEIKENDKNETSKEEDSNEDSTKKAAESEKIENIENTEKTKNTENEKEEKTTEAAEVSIGQVEQDYFDDVLFIGDSRTVGLSEYSYLDNATYYCDVGLSVYTVFDKKIGKVGKKSVTLEKALKKKQFKKIYIMLGINELGTGTTETFTEKYQEMLDKIRKLQPEAYLVIEAIMNVGKELSDTDKIFNNKNITDRNEGLEKLADNQTIFYLDVNEVLTDDDGYLPEEYTFDSIHLKGKYYDDWADFLMANGIIM